MKKLLFAFALIIASVAAHAQFTIGVTICELPQTGTGNVHDWLVKEDSSCDGTERISVEDFIALYGLGGGGGGGGATNAAIHDSLVANSQAFLKIAVDTIYNNTAGDSIVFEIKGRRHAIANKAFFGNASRVRYYGVTGKDTTDGAFSRTKYTFGAGCVSLVSGQVILTLDTTHFQLLYQGLSNTDCKVVGDNTGLHFTNFGTTMNWVAGDGSPGQVIATDGGGNLSFVDNSSGGGASAADIHDSLEANSQGFLQWPDTAGRNVDTKFARDSAIAAHTISGTSTYIPYFGSGGTLTTDANFTRDIAGSSGTNIWSPTNRAQLSVGDLGGSYLLWHDLSSQTIGVYANSAGLRLYNQTAWTWPTVDGTAGQVLKTDGAGTLGWATSIPTTRTITINGTTQDLSANRTWSVGTLTGPDTVALRNSVNQKVDSAKISNDSLYTHKVTGWTFVGMVNQGGTSSGIVYNDSVTTGHNNEVLYISPTGKLYSDANFVRDSADGTIHLYAIDGSGSAAIHIGPAGGTIDVSATPSGANGSVFFGPGSVRLQSYSDGSGAYHQLNTSADGIIFNYFNGTSNQAIAYPNDTGGVGMSMMIIANDHNGNVALGWDMSAIPPNYNVMVFNEGKAPSLSDLNTMFPGVPIYDYKHFSYLNPTTGFKRDIIAFYADGVQFKLPNDIFFGNTELRQIYMPQVDSIGRNALSGISILEYASFPNANYIGANAFNSSNLKVADVPNANYIDSSAFGGCQYITSINFPAVNHIGYSAFSNCSYITSANIPQATYLEQYAFDGCARMQTINAESIITTESAAFQGCEALKSIRLPSAAVISDFCFQNCDSLSSIYIPACVQLGYLGACATNQFAFGGTNAPTITTNAYLKTCDAGSPDADLLYAIGLGGSVIYIDNDPYGWKTSGNASTTPSDFIGTTDNVSLRLKANNIVVAKFDSTGDAVSFTGGVAVGAGATAFGLGEATGTNAFAGPACAAQGENAICIGGGESRADGAFAMYGQAFAISSFSWQSSTKGIGSIGLGSGTSTKAFQEVVIGHYPDTTGASTWDSAAWVGSDPAFTIGLDIDGGANRSNGLRMLKNGNTGIGRVNIPLAKLHVRGDSTMYESTDELHRMTTYWDAGAGLFRIYSPTADSIAIGSGTLKIAPNGDVVVSGLAGAGMQMMMADNNGKLISTAALPTYTSLIDAGIGGLTSGDWFKLNAGGVITVVQIP